MYEQIGFRHERRLTQVPAGYPEGEVSGPRIAGGHVFLLNPYGVTAPADSDVSPEGEFIRSALEARDLIADAKTVIMGRHDMAADEAFELLRQYSRSWDRPLRDVAFKIVHGTWVAEG